jgi:hypothetical protein
MVFLRICKGEKMNLSELKHGEAIELLEDFVLDKDTSLEKLESLISPFNIFEAVGMIHQEIRHSYFLTFLFNPSEKHGLGSIFLKLLLKHTLPKAEAVKIDNCDLSNTIVIREKKTAEGKSIDIFLLNKESKLTVTIENKIDSDEHSEQLKAYREYVDTQYPPDPENGYRNVFIFLTKQGDKPENEKDKQTYIPLSYATIVEILAEMLDCISQDNQPTVIITLIQHYRDMLEKQIVRDSIVTQYCQEINDEHKEALDLLFAQRLKKLAVQDLDVTQRCQDINNRSD